MLRMLETLATDRYTPRHYLMADTDAGSYGKAIKFEAARGGTLNRDFFIDKIPRARSVHQSYLTTPLSFLRASVASVRILTAARPNLVISNGPGTALPILLLSFLPRVLVGAASAPRLVYVESWARVGGLSLTGKLSWYFVDRFLVQWEMERVRNVEYVGRVV
ncbi:hypothetical protein HKX48_003820 [Thoreauomyces humboldtii]|nr:hypothetical protein HKX48_003820 [Thoreauomyces humboldtii]